MQRSLSFGTAAEDYERFRPGYPRALLELIQRAAEQPLRTAVEIGAGTGKATRLLASGDTSALASGDTSEPASGDTSEPASGDTSAPAAGGIEVTASEPDAAMLEVLRRTCDGLPVRPVRSTFENLDLDALGSFDLLCAASSLHWTAAQGRWDRAAALVRPGGLVASFGSPLSFDDPALAEVERSAQTRFLGAIDPPGPVDEIDGLQWPGYELAADERFADVVQQVIPRRLPYSRADCLGLLNTLSVYRQADPSARQAIFAELARTLPAQVLINADVTVHLARRV